MEWRCHSSLHFHNLSVERAEFSVIDHFPITINQIRSERKLTVVDRFFDEAPRLTLAALLDVHHPANAIIQRAGNLIGQMLASVVNFFNPSHVFIGGGVTQIGPLFLASVRQSVYHRSLALSTRHLEIQYTPLGAICISASFASAAA